MEPGFLDSSNSAWVAQAMMNRISDMPDPIIEALKPKIFPDGDQWCCIYGENLQESICGYGDTAAMAVGNFVQNYYSQKVGRIKSADDYEPPEPDMSRPDYKDEIIRIASEAQKLK
jgi:hypothetical protein